MGKLPSDGAEVPANTPFLLMGTIADTTWRMFVPSIGFTLLGVWLDSVFGTKPWLMFAGITVGALFAFILVRRQLASLKRSKR